MRLDFSRSAPPCDGPLNIARSTTVACCYVALKHLFTDVPANAGCLAPIEFVIPDTTLLGVSAPRPVGGYTETILRVIDVIFGAFAKAAPERANGSAVRHHQRAVARRLARARPALGDVLLLRRRARRQSGGRRAQPRQQSDLDRDHSAGGNPGVALSGDVHAMGAAAGFRRAGPASRRARRDLRDRGAGGRRRRGVPARRARQVSAVRRQRRRGRRRSIASSTRPTAARRRRRWSRRSPTSRSAAARRCGWKRRAAAASAIRRRASPSASRATCGSATSRARRRSRDYKVVLRDDGSLDADATAKARAADIGMSARWRHRRRRRRRHVHRPVPARRGDGHVPHRQGAVAARRRGARLPQRPAARSAASTAIGSIVHGTTVGTNTLLERRGPKIGVITTRGFRDVLEMRRRDRRRTWGLWGDFVPIADRDMRVEVDERTLADGTHPHRGRCRRRSAPRRKQLLDKRRAGARDHLHQRLRQCRQRAPRARGAARGLAERVRHRLARGAVRNPRVRALLDRGAQRLSAAGGRRPISASSKPRSATQSFAGQLHIVQSNGGIMSTATARRLPVRTALSGPAAGVVAGAAHRQGRGLRQCHHLRSRRHLVRRVGDRRRQGRGRGADHDRFRPGDPHADDRDHHHRRRRRLDRLGRSRRPAAGRPGKRGLGAGPGLLRPGQRRGRR